MNKRLLIVEDDALLGRAMRRLLGRAGYDATLAMSVGQARATPGPFDAGIFDVHLPDGNGVELADQLHRHGVVKTVVFFTGALASSEQTRASRLGPMVEKSDGIPALKSTVDAVLARPDRQAAVANGDPLDLSSAPPPSGVRLNDGDDE